MKKKKIGLGRITLHKERVTSLTPEALRRLRAGDNNTDGSGTNQGTVCTHWPPAVGSVCTHWPTTAAAGA